MANLQYPSIQMMQAKFCDDRTLESETIDMLINLMLGKNATSLSHTYLFYLKARYEEMRQMFDTNINDIVLNLYNQTILKIVLKQPGNIGLDVPTWYNMIDSKSRIMFISMVPKRATDNIQTKKSDFLAVSISSPFGLHRISDRCNKSKGERLAHILNHPQFKDCGFYFTDCCKFYFYDDIESHKISRVLKNTYLDILRQEIQNVFGGFSGKKLIVATGNDAQDCCDKLKQEIENEYGCQILHIPHITGAWDKTWEDRYEDLKNSTNKTEDLVKNIIEEISKVL